MTRPAQVGLTVGGFPPAKNTDQSSFAAGHGHYPRVVALLEEAAAVVGTPPDARTPSLPVFGTAPVVLEVQQQGRGSAR